MPGGVGLDIRAAANDTTLERFVRSRYDELQYLVSVCTGARVLAGSGVLNGKRATTNKSAWGFVTAKGIGENVSWVPSARWTTDGKVWTSSGVTAGLFPPPPFFLCESVVIKVKNSADGNRNGPDICIYEVPVWE